MKLHLPSDKIPRACYSTHASSRATAPGLDGDFRPDAGHERFSSCDIATRSNYDTQNRDQAQHLHSRRHSRCTIGQGDHGKGFLNVGRLRRHFVLKLKLGRDERPGIWVRHGAEIAGKIVNLNVNYARTGASVLIKMAAACASTNKKGL